MTIGLAGALLVATAALAHQGVKNPEVKARMDAMGEIAAATKVLGEMAKGAIAFDAAAAQEAARNLATQAARVPALFETPADDPKSEALPVIWERFDTFTEITLELEQAAHAATGIQTRDDLLPALRSIGATCKTCHEQFRE